MRKYYADEALKKAFADKLQGDVFGADDFRKGLLNFICAVIDETPAAEVDARQGYWARYEDEHLICATEFVCSHCNKSFTTSELTDEEFVAMMKYCPNCGCKMDEEGNDE